MDTQVLIVGAGPVGLTLALDLGRRGIRCTIIEQKSAPHMWPKMERCNARSMEFYRRLGISEKIRAAGLPSGVSMDVFIVTSLIEPPLLHLPYPSVDEARKLTAETNDGSMPLEPYQLISQYTLEPLLKSVVETLPSVTVRYGCEFLSFEQDANSVTATVSEGGQTKTITAQYMVGCDGGASNVRKQLGVKLAGEGNILQLRQALFHCEELFDRIPIGKGRHYHRADAQSTQLIVQDSTKHFTVHSVVEKDEDMKTVFEETVAMPVKYEMLYVGEWRQNLLVADRYIGGRVMLAGDAVHLVIPTGGLGMNTGVGDAIDLGWKLAGTLQGWGGPNLLASYEADRRPIGERNVGASRYASLGRRKWRAAYTPAVREKGPAGDAARAHLASLANVEQRKTNEMTGAELGYHYRNSPIIVQEPGDGPPDDYIDYVSSTWPGARLPHVWLKGNVAIQDLIGSGYTLLRVGPTAKGDTSALTKAFAKIGAPFETLDVPDQIARDLYGYDYLLLRPDMHVAWRGQQPPENPERLAAITTGHNT